ncbi:unnamed protein product [Miscanthus lutarioriparius]|uniref:Uncharacterized protein n=1 Tax=Miscanthus lutarioriparius TaxID=422564 RepID=A0A811MEV3_9POAL|nr:unnamed protein product [Miscanthus lutarioriparius]
MTFGQWRNSTDPKAAPAEEGQGGGGQQQTQGAAGRPAQAQVPQAGAEGDAAAAPSGGDASIWLPGRACGTSRSADTTCVPRRGSAARPSIGAFRAAALLGAGRRICPGLAAMAARAAATMEFTLAIRLGAPGGRGSGGLEQEEAGRTRHQ